MKKAGYLQQLDVPHHGTKIPQAMAANTYRLNWEKAKGSTHTNQKGTKNKSVGMCTNFDAFGHDAVRYTALGNAFATHQALESGVSSVAELSNVTGFTNQTVNIHLKKLEAHLLAERKLDGTWISHGRSWDEVAEELGTAGTRDRKMANYDRERTDYRAEQRQRCVDAGTAWEKDMLAQGYVKVRGCLFASASSVRREEHRDRERFEMEEDQIQKWIDEGWQWTGPHECLLVPPGKINVRFPTSVN
jgi:hypothetical protein